MAGHHIQQIIDGRDSQGRCPVHVAAIAGRADIIEQLIYVGCDCSAILHADLLGASKKKHPELEQSVSLANQYPNMEGAAALSQIRDQSLSCSHGAGTSLAGSPVLGQVSGSQVKEQVPEQSQHAYQGHGQGQLACNIRSEALSPRQGPLNSDSPKQISPEVKTKPQGVGIRVERDPGECLGRMKRVCSTYIDCYIQHLGVSIEGDFLPISTAIHGQKELFYCIAVTTVEGCPESQAHLNKRDIILT